MTEKLGSPEIVHEEGSFDEFLLSFYWEHNEQELRWSPDNSDIFQMLKMWFQSEDEGYPEGYGSLWQLFFIFLTQQKGDFGRDAAIENNQLTGGQAKRHFLKLVAEHGNELVAELESLVEQAMEERES